MPSEPSEADIKLLAPILDKAAWTTFTAYDGHLSVRQSTGEEMARAVLAALAEAGRLTPDGGQERDEYAVEWLSAGGGIAMDRMQITSWAEARDLGPKYVGQYNIAGYRVVRRRWRHFDDGSGTFGPWVAVDGTD